VTGADGGFAKHRKTPRFQDAWNLAYLSTFESKLQDERSRFSELPYELLEHTASYIRRGKHLVNWVEALKSSNVQQLGDLELLADLPSILEHHDFKVEGTLYIDETLTGKACILFGQMSHFFSRINFSLISVPTILSINLSKKPRICVNLVG
jgi:hypothetical protein